MDLSWCGKLASLGNSVEVATFQQTSHLQGSPFPTINWSTSSSKRPRLVDQILTASISQAASIRIYQDTSAKRLQNPWATSTAHAPSWFMPFYSDNQLPESHYHVPIIVFCFFILYIVDMSSIAVNINLHIDAYMRKCILNPLPCLVMHSFLPKLLLSWIF